MRRGGAAAVLAVVVALLAGCGGGGTTTVIEKTVTERVPVKTDSGATGAGDATKKAAAGQEDEQNQAEEAQKPQRIVHLRSFRSPSGNIGCIMFDGGARCDIRKRDWSVPPRPASCPHQVDYGQGLAVSRRGEASFVCAGDTALDPRGASVAYGTASELGGTECISRQGGITCVNQSGHGFFLSIQSYQVF